MTGIMREISLVLPPYPPARYTKDDPEVSAWLRRGDQPPGYDSFGLVKYHYLASEDDTAGDYGLYRVELAPKAGGPGPHFHRAMSEAFFVLSRAMKLYDGRDWVHGTQGDFLYVPPAASTASATRPTSLPPSRCCSPPARRVSTISRGSPSSAT
jgi:mannose-6-phosphate isomerase-like protein (cupin superfamily)